MDCKRSLVPEIDQKSQPAKRSRKSISLQVKLEVLKRFDRGEKISKISKVMGLAISTVGTIYENKGKLLSQAISAAPLNTIRLTRRRSNLMEKMEKLLLFWIEDNNQRNLPISNLTIQERAKSLFESLKMYYGKCNENEEFKGSQGWLEKFKHRHGLNRIKKKGQAKNPDHDAALGYTERLRVIIEEGKYLPQQIFNVDETELFWKRLPDCVYVSNEEISSPDLKVLEDRFTLLLGSNASGDFRLKPLIVYLNENKTALTEDINQIDVPVIWRSNKKGRMTTIIFEDWFKNYFIPEVEKYLETMNLSNKAMLLLDNAPGHPTTLQNLSPTIKIEYLPRNTTGLIQPMNQGVISSFKAYYLRRIFYEFIKGTDREDFPPFMKYLENLGIKDALNIISEAWQEINPLTLSDAWKNIRPGFSIENKPLPESLTDVFKAIVTLGNDLGFQNLTEADIFKLINTYGEGFSNDDLRELDDDLSLRDMDNKTSISSEFSSHLDKALSHFETGMQILVDNDPNEGRSSKVTRELGKIISCYKQLQEEKRIADVKDSVDNHCLPIETMYLKTSKYSDSDADYSDSSL